MRKNKGLLFCTVLLSIMLIFTGCEKNDRTVSENADENEVTGGINDNGGSYPENEMTVITPEFSGNESLPDDSDNVSRSDATDGYTNPGRPDDGENIESTNTPSVDEEKEILKINGLVRVQDVEPNVVVELKYATEDNFTGKKIYPHDVCVLREETAKKLAEANKELMEMGYRIKIWDAYRPVYAQKILWETVPDSRYVANPYKGGSNHSRGAAVDVTLVDMDGNELEMPSGFDDFTGKGSRNNKDMSENARKNMELLTEVMLKNGFTAINTEWWHYNDSDTKKYDIIDVDLEKFVENDGSDAESAGTASDSISH